MAKGSNTFEEYKKIKKELTDGVVHPVYLLQGAEFFFLNLILEQIENTVLSDADKDFNRHLFYGKDATISDIINACQRFPMMSDKQIVIVKEAHDLKKSDDILKYLNNPIPSTVLIWFHPKGKIAGNTRLFKAFDKYSVFTADEITESTMPQVIVGYLTSKGYKIDTNALRLAIDKGGNNFTNTLGELEKVLAVVPKSETISLAHIEKYVGINRKYNVFELQRALTKKEKTKSMDIVHFFLQNPKDNPPIMIMATLFSFFRKVAVFQSLKGKTEKEIMSLVGIPFMAISDYRTASNNYSVKQIQYVINLFHEADLQTKGILGTATNTEKILEELVVKILA